MYYDIINLQELKSRKKIVLIIKYMIEPKLYVPIQR
jgi:hypothetical protein